MQILGARRAELLAYLKIQSVESSELITNCMTRVSPTLHVHLPPAAKWNLIGELLTASLSTGLRLVFATA